MAFVHRIFLAVIFSALISDGCCISCLYCNSANNSACLDVSAYDEETIARVIPVVQCSVPGPHQPDFFCRKIVQIIYRSEHEAEHRVTRGCGWVRATEPRSCYHVQNSDHVETVCQCFSDRCNAADSADPASSVALFLLLSAVLYFYR